MNFEASYDIDKYRLVTFNVNNYSVQVNELPQLSMRESDSDGAIMRECFSDGLSKSKRTDLNVGFNYQRLFKNRAQRSFTLSYGYSTGIVDNSNIYDYDRIVNYDDSGRQKKFLRREGQHTFFLFK